MITVEVLENKVEALKREKRDEIKEWRKKVEERDRVIADLMAQVVNARGGGGPFTPLPRIEYKRFFIGGIESCIYWGYELFEKF